MTTTRIPSEEELIELENEVLAIWEFRAEQTDGYLKADRIVMNLRAVLDLARTVQNP